MPDADTFPDLRDLLNQLIQDLADLRAEISGTNGKPLTAAQLITRWHVGGDCNEDKLRNLQRKCAKRGLRPMAGSRGMKATYTLAAVLKAEASA